MPPCMLSDVEDIKTNSFNSEFLESGDVFSEDEDETDDADEQDNNVGLTRDDVSLLVQPFEPGDAAAVDAEARAETSEEFIGVRPSEFVYPPSIYEGYTPPLPRSTEREVTQEFMAELKGNSTLEHGNAVFNDEEFIEFDLVEFVMYLPGTGKHHPWELQGLQHLSSKSGATCFLFDGILGNGKAKKYVERVPFDVCSIGNYDKDFDSVDGQIWIRSVQNKKSDIYYRLKTPAAEYERFYENFLWLADFSKHCVDYMQHETDERRRVSIHNFRCQFNHWLLKTHGKSSVFRKWYRQHNHRDFRRAVAANIEFLWKEAIGVSSSFRTHPLWREARTLDHIPRQKTLQTKTVVTPYVYDCFKDVKSGVWLQPVQPSHDVKHRRRLNSLNLTVGSDQVVSSALYEPRKRQHPIAELFNRPLDPASIEVGDVVATKLDDASVSKWKAEPSKHNAIDEFWYVYIQHIRISKNGQREFDVIWLYRPADTTCSLMKYLYEDELFFSDHCGCGENKLSEDELLFKVPVAWHGSPGKSTKGFFVRQTYMTRNLNRFVTFDEKDKICEHFKSTVKTPFDKIMEEFEAGDTVLVVPPGNFQSNHGLEAAAIIMFERKETRGLVWLRRLRRFHDVYEDPSVVHSERLATFIKPNELVYTEQVYVIRAEEIIRRCHVRIYTVAQLKARHIPAPYDRDGTGDAYYITSALKIDSDTQKMMPISGHETATLRQGVDPLAPNSPTKLQGMDLYCGGGSFGRGLEEGGAVQNRWAVDLDESALHTYHANLKHAKEAKLFLGSVDDLLYQALLGNPKSSNLIPHPGEVDFISAGSPCTGYSTLNHRKDEERGLKNQSLVASVAAYIDFYRPKYALLENVTSMACNGKNRDEDMLSQLICCLVGMGYQVQTLVLDAWNFGSAQTRTRVFVSIAAPGLELPAAPGLSHSHPANVQKRGLGKLTNGQSFGKRRLSGLTPFKYRTAAEVTEGLPDIGDGRTYVCVSHPDHRMSKEINDKLKSQMEAIPLHPRGMNFVKTEAANLLSSAQRALFPNIGRNGLKRQSALAHSRAFERVHPQKMFPTITTLITPPCGRGGKALHWNQQRLITILEARIAQSYPEHEVIVGKPAKQWKIVGNSVARTVALALGMSLREAWLKNLPEKRKLPNPVEEQLQHYLKITTPLKSLPRASNGSTHSRDVQSLALEGKTPEIFSYNAGSSSSSERSIFSNNFDRQSSISHNDDSSATDLDEKRSLNKKRPLGGFMSSEANCSSKRAKQQNLEENYLPLSVVQDFDLLKEKPSTSSLSMEVLLENGNYQGYGCDSDYGSVGIPLLSGSVQHAGKGENPVPAVTPQVDTELATASGPINSHCSINPDVLSRNLGTKSSEHAVPTNESPVTTSLDVVAQQLYHSNSVLDS